MEIPVEVYKPLPATLTNEIPYPAALPENFTVDDALDLTFALFDKLDLANKDRAKAAGLTEEADGSD